MTNERWCFANKDEQPKPINKSKPASAQDNRFLFILLTFEDSCQKYFLFLTGAEELFLFIIQDPTTSPFSSTTHRPNLQTTRAESPKGLLQTIPSHQPARPKVQV